MLSGPDCCIFVNSYTSECLRNFSVFFFLTANLGFVSEMSVATLQPDRRGGDLEEFHREIPT